MDVIKDETLGYEKKKKTAHNVCFRQIMDDANRLKCNKYQ